MIINREVKRSPRILWANRYCLLDTSSGASISVYQILKQLKNVGWEVEIIGATIFEVKEGKQYLERGWGTIPANPAEVIDIDDAGITQHLVVTGSTQHLAMTEKEIEKWYSLYGKFLSQYRPDVVFFYGGLAVDWLISGEAHARGIPSVAYLANGNYKSRRWCRDVDLIVTDTESTADLYKKESGFIPVPVGKFIDQKKILTTTNTRKYISFINPSLQKGAMIVAQLAILLEKRRPDIIFQVVESRGKWNKVVTDVTTTFGKPRQQLANVIVIPHTNDMRSVYANSRLLLVPSLFWESGARVLAEAMINGIPVLATAYGGNMEMIQNGGVCFTLPSKCYEKPYKEIPAMELLQPLVGMIVQFFDNESYYQVYVQRAYQVGKKQYDMNASTCRLIDVFSPLIEKQAGDLDHHSLSKSTHKHDCRG